MGNGLEIIRERFRVRCDPDEPWAWLDLPVLHQPLLIEAGVDTPLAFDRSVSVTWDGCHDRGDHERLAWAAKSTLWAKRYHLDVYAGHAEFGAEIFGDGMVDSVRYFDAIADASFTEHFSLVKHFNDKGQTDSREHSTGSPARFSRVFCPEPNAYARQLLRPHEYGQVSVNADLDYYGGNFAACPALLCFAVSACQDGEWLAFGLAPEPGRYLFSEYEYLGGADFALRLNLWGALRVRGAFKPPRMIIVPGDSAEDALARYVRVLRDRGLTPRPSREPASWWHRPIVCGWGHQSYQADLFRVRSTRERPPDNAAYMLCTQPTYRDLTERLDNQQLPWGTLVIDARWFLAGGLKNVDSGRWPDLRGFIAEQHRQDRRVLLWWSPWDTEGIPAAECVRYLPGNEPGRQNRPGRLAKFGAPVPGKKLAPDITLPAVRDRIREQVRLLLGAAGFGADGFKVDHVAAAPGIYGMEFPDGSGKLFGIEAARSCLELLHETAKDVKPDALLIGQSPNPYLADVQDMLRLGDIYTVGRDSVLPEMKFRASMARLCDPDWLIDTDGWPMPSLRAFREYVRHQPELGVPSLYYATHLDTTGEPLTAADYAGIRRAWAAL